MAHLKLFVLGQPRLERGEAPVELNLRKALALLIYLAVSGQPHSRDALATLLWPESDQREGRAGSSRRIRMAHALPMPSPKAEVDIATPPAPDGQYHVTEVREAEP